MTTEAPFLTPAQIGILRGMYSQKKTPGEKPNEYLTDAEFAQFIEIVQRRKLDPFTRQIYWTKRASKDDDGGYTHRMQVEAQIDGLRLIAQRTGQYAGQLGPFWYDAAGEMGAAGRWVDVWLGKDAPLAAKVGILRHDFKEPLWGVANWSAYAQFTKAEKLNRIWDRMGPHMLAKTAEALGLRKAFPEDLSGLTIEEEAAGVDRPIGNLNPNSDATPSPPVDVPPPESAKATVADEHGEVLSLQQWRDRVRAAQKALGIPDLVMKDISHLYVQKRTSQSMMIPDCQKLLECLKRDEEKIKIDLAALSADKPVTAGAGK